MQLERLLEEFKNKQTHLNQQEIELEMQQKSQQEFFYLKSQIKRQTESDCMIQIEQARAKLDKVLQIKQSKEQELQMKCELLDQKLETKAKLKEDLNGKLIQRAELVAIGEELEQIIHDYNQHSSLEIEYVTKNSEINRELSMINNKLRIVNAAYAKNEQIMQNEVIPEMVRLTDLKQSFVAQHQTCQWQRAKLVKGYFEEMDNLHEYVQTQCDEIKTENAIMKEFDAMSLQYIAQFINDEQIWGGQIKILQFLQNNKKEKYQEKCKHLETQFKQAFSSGARKQQEMIQEEINTLTHFFQNENIKYENWKHKIELHGQLILQNRLKTDSHKFDVQSAIAQFNQKTSLSVSIDLKHIEIFDEALQLFFKSTLSHYKNLQEKEIEVENEREESMEEDDQLEMLKTKKVELENNLQIEKQQISDLVLQQRSQEEQKREINQVFEHLIRDNANRAFSEYLIQQAGVFEQLSKTYGQKQAENTKQEHYQQFISIMRSQQESKMDKYTEMLEDMTRNERLVSDNIAYVDNKVLIDLKEIVQCTSQMKSDTLQLKKQVVPLIDESSKLEQKLSVLTNEMEARVKTAYEQANLGQQKEDEYAMSISRIRSNIEMLLCETEIIENDILTLEKEKTLFSQQQTDSNELQNLQQQLRIIQQNKNNTQMYYDIEEKAYEGSKEFQHESPIKKYLSLLKHVNNDSPQHSKHINVSYDKELKHDATQQKVSYYEQNINKFYSTGKKQIHCQSKNQQNTFMNQENYPIQRSKKIQSKQNIVKKKVLINRARSAPKIRVNTTTTDNTKNQINNVAIQQQKEMATLFKQQRIVDKYRQATLDDMYSSIKKPVHFTDNSRDQIEQLYKIDPQNNTEYNANISSQQNLQQSVEVQKWLNMVNLNAQNGKIKQNEKSNEIKSKQLKQKNNDKMSNNYNIQIDNQQQNNAQQSSYVQLLEKQQIFAQQKHKRNQSTLASLKENVVQNINNNSFNANQLQYQQNYEQKYQQQMIPSSVLQTSKVKTLGSYNFDSQHQILLKQDDTYKMDNQSLIMQQQSNVLSKRPSCTIEQQAVVCKYNMNNQDCPVHKQYFKFDTQNSSLEVMNFFDKIRPLLEGMPVYKKHSNNQLLNQPQFKPLENNKHHTPELCGYGLRSMTLSRHLDKLEFRNINKHNLNYSVPIAKLISVVIPSMSNEIVKIQKRFDQIRSQFEINQVTTNQQEGQQQQVQKSVDDLNRLFQEGRVSQLFTDSHRFEQLLKCKLYTFSVIMEENGRVEFIAEEYSRFKAITEGINALIKFKKRLPQLQQKVAVLCL